MLRQLSDLFWRDELWWPVGFNWSTLALQSSDTVRYPDFNDMYLTIYYALGFLLTRAIFEWSIARPLGKWLGVTDTRSEIVDLIKIMSWRITRMLPFWKSNSFRNYETTVFIRKSKLDKFSESAWRFVYYFSMWIYGLWALWDKSWLWENVHCWDDYPFHQITTEIWWYYILQTSFYWSLLMSQFVDVQRKDFCMMFVHHITTISLLWFSWADNFVRIGTLVLVLHDAADLWMELGKTFRYADYVYVPNVIFAVFTLVWFVTRVVIYPYRHMLPTSPIYSYTQQPRKCATSRPQLSSNIS